MKLVDKFQVDDEFTVTCPDCDVGVLMPTEQLKSFVCPLCRERFTLKDAKEGVDAMVKKDPTLNAGNDT